MLYALIAAISLWLVAHVLVRVLFDSARGKGAAAVAPAPTRALQQRLARVSPKAATAIRSLPSLRLGADRAPLPALPPPSADLSTIGIADDKQEADAAVWRAVREALAQAAPTTAAKAGR